MARLRIVFPIALCFWGLASTGFAQNIRPTIGPDQAVASAPKTHVNKSAHKARSAARGPASPTPEQAEKARIDEARKKFFEESIGFDHGDSGSPLSFGGRGGVSPGIGYKF